MNCSIIKIIGDLFKLNELFVFERLKSPIVTNYALNKVLIFTKFAL